MLIFFSGFVCVVLLKHHHISSYSLAGKEGGEWVIFNHAS